MGDPAASSCGPSAAAAPASTHEWMAMVANSSSASSEGNTRGWAAGVDATQRNECASGKTQCRVAGWAADYGAWGVGVGVGVGRVANKWRGFRAATAVRCCGKRVGVQLVVSVHVAPAASPARLPTCEVGVVVEAHHRRTSQPDQLLGQGNAGARARGACEDYTGGTT